MAKKLTKAQIDDINLQYLPRLTVSNAEEYLQKSAARSARVRTKLTCRIDALARDKTLSPEHSPDQATDILWTMLSVRNWEQLTIGCGWPQERYIETLKSMARRIFVAERVSS